MQVNVEEAKSQVSTLLELVEQGEKAVIAQNGQPVADLSRPNLNAASPLELLKMSPSCFQGMIGGLP